MPPPLYAARCSPYTPYACGAQRALRHEYSWSTFDRQQFALGGSHPYKLCSDLNSQPKWPGDLDFWPWKWCPSHVWRGLPVSILVFLGLSVLDLGPMYATDRQTSDTDVRQHHRLMPPPIRGEGITMRRFLKYSVGLRDTELCPEKWVFLIRRKGKRYPLNRQLRTQSLQYKEFFDKITFIWFDSVFHIVPNGRCWLFLCFIYFVYF